MDRANDVKGAFGDGVNNTDTASYTVSTGSGTGTGFVDPIPVGWYGEFVEIISVGADSRFFFTLIQTATINPSVAATATGALSPQHGELAQSGVPKQVLVPTAGPGVTVFIARASASSPISFDMTKRSGKPGNNTTLGG